MSGQGGPGDVRHYRVKDVERMLAVSRSTVYALMASGQLGYVKIGRCRRVPHSAVSALLRRGGSTRPSAARTE